MRYRKAHIRRQIMAVFVAIAASVAIWAMQLSEPVPAPLTATVQQELFGSSTASEQLEELHVKGRAPKTGYTRAQFGDGWGVIDGCSIREVILARDLTNVAMDPEKCRVQTGVLQDPYTSVVIQFQRGETTSQAVQIDHVVALSDAWQKGAQQISREERVSLANDPLNLLAVDGPVNQSKSDADAATWLPPNKLFRCQYVARQIAVKRKYHLWVTDAEKQAMMQVLQACAS